MIRFDNWILTHDGEIIARQFDHKTRTITITGDIPTGWNWELLVSVKEAGAFDIIPLTASEGALSAVLTEEQLSIAGYYTLQLRGNQGEPKKHTNQLEDIYIPASLSGCAHWPELPTAFSEMEARVKAQADRAEAASEHPPIIGPDGTWQIWEGNAYQDTGLPSHGENGTNGTPGAPGKDYVLTEQDREEIAALASTPDQYVLIDSITTTEEVNEIRRTVEPDGTPYSFKRIMANIYCPAGTAGSMFVWNGSGVQVGYISNVVSTTERYSQVTVDVSRGYIEGLYTAPNNKNAYPTVTTLAASVFRALSVLDGIRFAGPTFPVGTKIDIYGVRINPSGSIDALADDIISKQEQYIGGDA